VRPRMGGNCFLVRFADDFVMGYALKGDAEKVFRVLPKRFERFPMFSARAGSRRLRRM
jgi:RNA-directed DNA polymerase